MGGRLGQSIRETEDVCEIGHDSWKISTGCGDVRRSERLVRFHQERGAAVDARAHQLDALLRVVPTLYNYIFKFFMKELFNRLFVGAGASGVCHLNKVRQHSNGLEAEGFSCLDVLK